MTREELRYIVEDRGLSGALQMVATTEIDDHNLASYWNKAQIVNNRILEILFPEDNVLKESEIDNA